MATPRLDGAIVLFIVFGLLMSLSETDLTGANLMGAQLTDAILSETVLTGANLSETELSRAKLSSKSTKWDPARPPTWPRWHRPIR